MFTTNQSVALFSVREVANFVAFAYLYEFEDVIASLLDADVIKPNGYETLERYHKLYKFAKLITKSSNIADFLIGKNIRPSLQTPLRREYDVLICFFNIPYELFMIKALGDWRKKCEKAICYITEMWLHEIDKWQHFMGYLKEFDHIFLASQQCVQTVAEMTGRPCTYLPISIDTFQFCPTQTSRSQRLIDVLNLGRRSPITHQALLEFAEKNHMFYMYDTISNSNVKNSERQQTFTVKNPREHRYLLANILKRSRYYIANRARINDSLAVKNRQEISVRFFEGAAAGAVLLGEPPEIEEFQQNFGWKDAVIHVPFDSPNIGDIITHLNQQPERLEKIVRNNVSQSLLRHDSVYRLKTMFEVLNLPPTPSMINREQKLAQLTQQFLGMPSINIKSA